MLIQASPEELKLVDERLYEAPAAEVTPAPFTWSISPEPDGVKVAVSPGARTVAFPAASLSVTLISEPLSPAVAETHFGAAVFLGLRVTVETPDDTLMVNTLYDSEPDSDACEVAIDPPAPAKAVIVRSFSFQTVTEYVPATVGVKRTVATVTAVVIAAIVAAAISESGAT
jgi:hypothetical protein